MENGRPTSIAAVPPSTRISSPSSPAPFLCRPLPPQWIRSEDQRCSVPHPSVSISSPPLLMVNSKPEVSPSAPLKRFRGNEIVAQFTREPYEAALYRQRAASVAAALEHSFWARKTGKAEGDVEDYLVAMTGAKLAKALLFE